MTRYCHTQTGWAVIFPVALILGVSLGLAIVEPGSRPALPWITGFVVVVLTLFATLTVTVDNGWVRCHYGPGLIRRNIPLGDVRRVEAVRNRWWYGWGIRLTPHGWLWNVSGLDAVELTYANGRTFRIGTDEPRKLQEAIRAGLTRPAGDPPA